MISVIVPTLNEEKYLPYLLDSLEHQTYEDFEIIVVDGNSKDRTVEIAKKYTSKVFVLEKKGISIARNYGAKKAEGDKLIFIDADMILLPNFLKAMEKGFKGKIGATCPIIPLAHEFAIQLYYWLENQVVKESIRLGRALFPGRVLGIRKDVFKQVKGFDEKLSYGEDVDFTFRASKHGKFAWVEDTLALTWPRREKKWGMRKIMKALFLYFPLEKLFGKKIKYPPIR